MAEYFFSLDLTTPPTRPLPVPFTKGIPFTGVIVNGPLPAGLTLKVSRVGSQDGIILAGAPAAGQGGDSLLNFFCPPAIEGIAFLWDIAAPGQSASICLVSSGEESSLSRA